MPGTRHRAVVDTNRWISFLLTKDFTRLDQLLSNDQLTLLFSQDLLNEFVEVAERPKFRRYFPLDDLQALLREISHKAEFVTVTATVTFCRDSKDNFLLALAQDGAASHLLTGDQDLLTLHPFGTTQILTIADYLAHQSA